MSPPPIAPSRPVRLDEKHEYYLTSWKFATRLWAQTEPNLAILEKHWNEQLARDGKKGPTYKAWLATMAFAPERQFKVEITDVDYIVVHGFAKLMNMRPRKVPDREEISSDTEILTSESETPRNCRRGGRSSESRGNTSDLGRGKGRSSHHAVSSRHHAPPKDHPERHGISRYSGYDRYGHQGYTSDGPSPNWWENDSAGVFD